jgi:membrane protein DedA with SNARE-associated domain
MEEMFIQFCETLTNNPWLQALVIIVFTCFIEDPARCAVVVMLKTNLIANWWLTFASMTIGGMIGDIGLYVIGRFAMNILVRYRFADPDRVDYIKAKYGDHAAWASFIARFVPGLRTLVYVSTGSMRYPFGRFLVILFLAAATQAYLFLLAADFIKDHILRHLESKTAQIGLALLLIGAMYAVSRFLTKRTKKRSEEEIRKMHEHDAQ